MNLFPKLGTTRVWRLDDGYSMALLAHGADWIVYTPDGYFDSSHYGGDLISVTRGLDTFGIDQFALQLNRPDLILSRMGLGSPEFIDHLHSQYERRLERSGFRPSASGLSLEAPEVHLVQAKQDGKFAQLEAELTDQHYPLGSYRSTSITFHCSRQGETGHRPQCTDPRAHRAWAGRE